MPADIYNTELPTFPPRACFGSPFLFTVLGTPMVWCICFAFGPLRHCPNAHTETLLQIVFRSSRCRQIIKHYWANLLCIKNKPVHKMQPLCLELEGADLADNPAWDLSLPVLDSQRTTRPPTTSSCSPPPTAHSQHIATTTTITSCLFCS